MFTFAEEKLTHLCFCWLFHCCSSSIMVQAPPTVMTTSLHDRPMNALFSSGFWTHCSSSEKYWIQHVRWFVTGSRSHQPLRCDGASLGKQALSLCLHQNHPMVLSHRLSSTNIISSVLVFPTERKSLQVQDLGHLVCSAVPGKWWVLHKYLFSNNEWTNA